MKSLRFLILLGITVVVHAQAGPVGCYSVVVAEKSETSPSQLRKPEHLVRAKNIRLTSKHTSTPWPSGEMFQVLSATPLDSFAFGASYWQWKKEGLAITWSNNGLSGVEMILKPTASGFEGTIVFGILNHLRRTTDKRF